MPEQTSRVTPVRSSTWRRTAIAIVIIALTAGTSGYLLGIRTNKNISQGTQRVSFQPSSIITAQSSVSTPSPISTQAVPTPIIVTYRNEQLGFEFKHDARIYAMEETANKVSFGFTYPVLTISTNQTTDYKSYRPCEYKDETNTQTLPCLENGERWGQKGDIIGTTLGQVSAKSFYIAEKYPTEAYPHAYYHIVQTTDSPKIEAKMHLANVAPETFDLDFKQMLSTFKLLGNM